MLSLLTLLLTAQGALSSTILPRQSSDNTAVVDLSVKRGAPNHYAAGILYGEPDTQNQIPDSFYTQTGIKYGRAGGAQLPAPSRGWIWGLVISLPVLNILTDTSASLNEYKGRFQSTLSNYKTIRKYGGTFIILPHDIWGTDHANSSTVWPGDNGNWTDYDNFLNQLFSDIKANGMTTAAVFDIWNEPDGSFWARSQQQYFDLYVRTHKRIRSDPSLNAMLISGPSYAAQPTTSNSWWTGWLSLVKGNNTIPDQYSWHIEGDINDVNDDLQTNNATLTGMLKQYALPARQVNINEYAVFDEQVASGAAWWISRLERYDSYGLRGNWLSNYALHDYMASLLGKPNADTSSYDPNGGGYWPNGEFQVYKYYASNMTGTRAQTTGTGDRIMDVYTTIGGSNDRKVRTLTGTRLKTGVSPRRRCK